MSVCVCPHVGLDGMESPEHRKAVRTFLNGIEPEGRYAKSDWSLATLIDMARAGNSVAEITSSIPFRGGACARTRRCCGDCVRQCYTRCVQDCLHRLWMWNQAVESTPEAEREKIPLAIRLIVNQKFESHRHMSWCVGEILSQKTNAALKEYMITAGLSNNHNPYRNDYGPVAQIDSTTGMRIVHPITGNIQFLDWPDSGLCPHCLPNVLVDARYIRKVDKHGRL